MGSQSNAPVPMPGAFVSPTRDNGVLVPGRFQTLSKPITCVGVLLGDDICKLLQTEILIRTLASWIEQPLYRDDQIMEHTVSDDANGIAGCILEDGHVLSVPKPLLRQNPFGVQHGSVVPQQVVHLPHLVWHARIAYHPLLPPFRPAAHSPNIASVTPARPTRSCTMPRNSAAAASDSQATQGSRNHTPHSSP